MKLKLIIILIIIANNSYSQSYFNKRFNFQHPWVFDGAVNATEVSDGYIVNGVTGDSANIFWHRIAVAKVDYEGNILWSKTWGDTISTYFFADRGSLIQAHNAYYSVGSRRSISDNDVIYSESFLIKYNDDFDTLWCNYFGNVNPPYDSIWICRNFISTDDGFLFTGTYQADEYHTIGTFLIKTDTLGNKIWKKTYTDSTHYIHGLSVVQTSDGGYAIGNYRWVIGQYGASIGDPYIIKTDNLGNIEWELNVGGPYQDDYAILCNSFNGNIICGSRIDVDSIYYDRYKSRLQLVEITTSGSIVKQKQFCDPKLFFTVSNIRRIGYTGYIISGKTGDTDLETEPTRMGFLLNISTSFDSLWYRQYGICMARASRNLLYDAIPVSDGGFLGAGYCLSATPDTGTQDVWIIKVDSMGCTSPWDCWVMTDELLIGDNNYNFSVYPNPATSEVNFDFQRGIVEWNTMIELFNINGKLLKRQNNIKQNNKINITELMPGLYLYKITSGSYYKTGKFIVTR